MKDVLKITAGMALFYFVVAPILNTIISIIMIFVLSGRGGNLKGTDSVKPHFEKGYVYVSR